MSTERRIDLGQVSQEDVLRLRGLVIEDPVALKKWQIIVDHIVNSAVDIREIKRLIKDGGQAEMSEAVLKSLQIWQSYDDQRADLANVLQSHGLNALWGRIVEENIGASNEARIWFEVGELPRNFTGRVAELEQLHNLVTEAHGAGSGTVIVSSVSGCGGVGKSTLARKYAIDNWQFYDGNVIWINADSMNSLRSSFIRLARSLGLKLTTKAPPEELTEKVYKKLKNTKCLIVFDNVEEKIHVNQYRPKFTNPTWRTPYVLITSRRSDLVQIPKYQLPLDVLNLDEAVELIQRQLTRSSRENAEKLAVKLQRLPLALQQAIAYIQDQYINDEDCIGKYLEEFETSEKEQTLLNDGRFKEDNDYELTVFMTWKTTLKKIKEVDHNRAAINLINALSYINPDNVSLELLDKMFPNGAEPGVRLLEKFSMITLNTQGKGVAIHRLVQHVIRLQFGSDQELEIIQSVMESLAATLDPSEITELTRECTTHGLALFPYLLRHDEMIINGAGPRYVHALCHYLQMCGNYPEGANVAQRASERVALIFGSEHEHTIRMRWATADACHFAGDTKGTLAAILAIPEHELANVYGLPLAILPTMARIQGCKEIGDTLVGLLVFNYASGPKFMPYKGNMHTLAYMDDERGLLLKLGKWDEALRLGNMFHEKMVELYGEKDMRSQSAKLWVDINTARRKQNLEEALELWRNAWAELGRSFGVGHLHTKLVQVEVDRLENNLRNLNPSENSQVDLMELFKRSNFFEDD